MMIDQNEFHKLAKNIQAHAFKRGYVSAFTFAKFPVESHENLAVHVTRECIGLVYGNAEVDSVETLAECVKILDGRVDYIVVDLALHFNIRPTAGSPRNTDEIRDLTYYAEFDNSSYRPEKSSLLYFHDEAVWVKSVIDTLLACVPDLPAKKFLIHPGNSKELSDMNTGFIIDLMNGLIRFCYAGHIYDDAEPFKKEVLIPGTDILIGASIYRPCITVDEIIATGKSPIIVDAGIGTITHSAAEYARKNDLTVIRVDNRAAMAGTLISLIHSHDLMNRVRGCRIIDGVTVVAGGYIGAPGDVIVDSIDAPSMVIGIADGTGRVIYEPENPEHIDSIQKVKSFIEKGVSDA